MCLSILSYLTKLPILRDYNHVLWTTTIKSMICHVDSEKAFDHVDWMKSSERLLLVGDRRASGHKN